MTKKEFYRFIEKGAMQGVCRYFEYFFVYQNVPENSKVLEIGPGFSALGQSLRLKGCEVHGLEIDNLAVEYQVKHGIPTNINVGDCDYKNYFDVVVAASSIEHFDPKHDGDIKQIEDIKKALKPSGLFIVTIPTGDNYIKSRTNPPEKVYTMNEFEERFLNGFEVRKMVFYEGSNDIDNDLIIHKGWKFKSNKVVDHSGNGIGLCAVLRKI